MASSYLTTEEVASLLSVSVSTVKRWRAEGKGPRVTRFERSIRYLRSDVLIYMRDSRKD